MYSGYWECHSDDSEIIGKDRFILETTPITEFVTGSMGITPLPTEQPTTRIVKDMMSWQEIFHFLSLKVIGY